jgi:hypothetical protein
MQDDVASSTAGGCKHGGGCPAANVGTEIWLALFESVAHMQSYVVTGPGEAGSPEQCHTG